MPRGRKPTESIEKPTARERELLARLVRLLVAQEAVRRLSLVPESTIREWERSGANLSPDERATLNRAKREREQARELLLSVGMPPARIERTLDKRSLATDRVSYLEAPSRFEIGLTGIEEWLLQRVIRGWNPKRPKAGTLEQRLFFYLKHDLPGLMRGDALHRAYTGRDLDGLDRAAMPKRPNKAATPDPDGPDADTGSRIGYERGARSRTTPHRDRPRRWLDTLVNETPDAAAEARRAELPSRADRAADPGATGRAATPSGSIVQAAERAARQRANRRNWADSNARAGLTKEQARWHGAARSPFGGDPARQIERAEREALRERLRLALGASPDDWGPQVQATAKRLRQGSRALRGLGSQRARERGAGTFRDALLNELSQEMSPEAGRLLLEYLEPASGWDAEWD